MATLGAATFLSGISILYLAATRSALEPLAPPPAINEAIARLAQQAEGIRLLLETGAAGEMLDQVRHLPAIEPRTIWFRKEPRAALRDDQFQLLAEAERMGFERLEFDTRRYYETFYGTPLASLRAFDLAAMAGGFESFAGRRVLDIGYGSIGQLRLLGEVGANVVGVEVEPLLHTLYSFPGDSEVKSDADAVAGSIKLVLGFWPRDVAQEVGEGFDLIVSKNTLKKGYVTPEVPDPLGRGVDLSAAPQEYVRALHKALNPGGVLIIYNIGPGPGPDGKATSDPGAPVYVHMADIRCPFPREMLLEAGFEIITFDEADSIAIREYATEFGWNDEVQQSPPMDLEKDLFAMFTILRKRAGN